MAITCQRSGSLMLNNKYFILDKFDQNVMVMNKKSAIDKTYKKA